MPGLSCAPAAGKVGVMERNYGNVNWVILVQGIDPQQGEGRLLLCYSATQLQQKTCCSARVMIDLLVARHPLHLGCIQSITTSHER